MEAGDRCILRGENRQYLLSVLRMRKGQSLLLFDGKGSEYEAVIQEQDQESVELEITSKETIPVNGIKITLAQSLPKSKKMDFIIEKACELGATRIIPFLSLRSVPHLGPEKTASKQLRWQKIALEAARKSHSMSVPEVTNVLSFEDMLRSADGRDMRIIFWEEETGKHLRQVLQLTDIEQGRNFFLVVGPEGGFGREEIALAERLGFTSVSLGKQVLKVETASLAILSIIQYEKGMFRPDIQNGGKL